MKSNKGILTNLVKLTQLILQARINPSPRLRQHLDTLLTQLQLLRSQLLPSTEIVHFLVDRQSYGVKSKIATQLKTIPLQQLCLTIAFTVTDKLTSVSHIGQVWRLWAGEINGRGREVSRESRAHELLSLLGWVLQQLTSKDVLSDLVRNREASKKFIIDFKIEITALDKSAPKALGELGKVCFNYAALDDTRQLNLECYSNLQLGSLLGLGKRSPYATSGKGGQKVKGISENTRGDSAELWGSEGMRKRFLSQQENRSTIFEVYDSELDLTILSSDSDQWSGGNIVSEVNVGEDEEFELLVEDGDKEDIFLRQNQGLFMEWQNAVLNTFT